MQKYEHINISSPLSQPVDFPFQWKITSPSWSLKAEILIIFNWCFFQVSHPISHQVLMLPSLKHFSNLCHFLQFQGHYLSLGHYYCSVCYHGSAPAAMLASNLCQFPFQHLPFNNSAFFAKSLWWLKIKITPQAPYMIHTGFFKTFSFQLLFQLHLLLPPPPPLLNNLESPKVPAWSLPSCAKYAIASAFAAFTWLTSVHFMNSVQL